MTAPLFGSLYDAEMIDLADYFPGPLARTHVLRALDGRHYHFSGDPTSGVWVRSLDPGFYDYHLWQPDGMYYLGWQTPAAVYWSVPPELALPRYWDPRAPWSRIYPNVVAKRSADGTTTIQSSIITITVRRVIQQGEPLIYMTGGTEGADMEQWWISPSLPVRGGGVSPGFRGFQMTTGTTTTGMAEFLEWVPRALIGDIH
jgi:hypothetical protein